MRRQRRSAEAAAVMRLAGDSAELQYFVHSYCKGPAAAAARHIFGITFNGAVAARDAALFTDRLSSHGFNLRGRIVAKARVIHTDRSSAPLSSTLVTAELIVLEKL